MKIFNKKNAKRKVDYSKVINNLMKENEALRKRNKELVDLCGEKDSYFMDLMSDALRHGRPIHHRMNHRNMEANPP